MSQLSNKYIEKVEKEAFFVYNSAGFSGDAKFDPRVNPNLAHRVPENKICTLANNKIWQNGYNFTPYDGMDGSNSYFLNTINNVVYLLLEKGPNNRKDEWNNYLSTVLPTHEIGMVKTSDNHTWFAYYKVPENKVSFIDSKNLPVPLSFYPKDDYTSFLEKYEINCLDGVTTYGCCCLYHKDYSQDEITGEIYNIGDVTNETIFSECYECQKLADLMDKDFIFLSGQTAGSIKTNITDENPLCPATKNIDSLVGILDNTTLSSNSYLFFQRKNINAFANNSGIASITLDLSGTNPDDLKLTVENPKITFLDPTGSGAEATLKTYKKIINGIVYHIPYGIDLINRGKDYSFADIQIEGSGTSHTENMIYNKINIVQFPTDFLTNVSKIVIPQRTSYENSINSTDLIQYFSGAEVASVSLLLQPKTKDSVAANNPPNNNALIPLVDFAYLGQIDSVEEVTEGDPELAGTEESIYVDAQAPYQNSTNGNYNVYLSHLATSESGTISYSDGEGSTITIDNGWKVAVNDTKESIKVGDILLLPNAQTQDPNELLQYSVRKIIRSELNKLTGQIVSTLGLTTPINLTSEVSRAVKTRTFRITINS